MMDIGLVPLILSERFFKKSYAKKLNYSDSKKAISLISQVK